MFPQETRTWEILCQCSVRKRLSGIFQAYVSQGNSILKFARSMLPLETIARNFTGMLSPAETGNKMRPAYYFPVPTHIAP